MSAGPTARVVPATALWRVVTRLRDHEAVAVRVLQPEFTFGQVVGVGDLTRLQSVAQQLLAQRNQIASGCSGRPVRASIRFGPRRQSGAPGA